MNLRGSIFKSGRPMGLSGCSLAPGVLHPLPLFQRPVLPRKGFLLAATSRKSEDRIQQDPESDSCTMQDGAVPFPVGKISTVLLSFPRFLAAARKTFQNIFKSRIVSKVDAIFN